MSTGRRAYDLLRGYVNREYERIQDVYESSAEQELQDSLEKPMQPTLQGESEQSEVVVLTQEQKARLVLGVSPQATFDEIKAAFDRLNERCDVDKFLVGSAEADQAAQIRSRVYRAFRILSDLFDPTEKRFKSLEIE